jgi:putative addiction module component (TIGR02574 family)
MPTTVEKIKGQIRKLSAKQRTEVARFLLKSLDEDQESAFDKELERRVNEIRSGRARGIPAEQVFAKLREKYG